MIFLSALLAVQAEIGKYGCEHPARDDLRPYTHCLAETYGDEVERKLRRQLRNALKHVSRSKGERQARYLRLAQSEWDKERSRKCADQAKEAPISQQGYVQLTCLARIAEPRIAHLAAMANGS